MRSGLAIVADRVTTRARMAAKRPRRPALTAKTADKYDLYQRSVQAPEYEVFFANRLFRRHAGRKPLVFREDFCGTGLLCAEWVQSDPERRAIGIDIDPKVLEWGRRHNVEPLDEAGARIELLVQDVSIPTTTKADVVGAYNYSYSVFKTRDAMRRYFQAVKRSLVPDGLFILDAFGGWDAQREVEEHRKVGNFTYVWEQTEYDPISSHLVCYISFEFRDRSKLERVFTYDWRLWQLRELRELLIEAGFVEVECYWEGEDENGEGTGEFSKVARASNDPGWNAYLVAKKRPSRATRASRATAPRAARK